MPVRMGLREANQRFSQAIKVVKAGQEVVLTERGDPIAVIKPLPGTARPDDVLLRLEAVGLIRRAARPGRLGPWTPRTITGVPVTETLREERDAR